MLPVGPLRKSPSSLNPKSQSSVFFVSASHLFGESSKVLSLLLSSSKPFFYNFSSFFSTPWGSLQSQGFCSSLSFLHSHNQANFLLLPSLKVLGFIKDLSTISRILSRGSSLRIAVLRLRSSFCSFSLHSTNPSSASYFSHCLEVYQGFINNFKGQGWRKLSEGWGLSTRIFLS